MPLSLPISPTHRFRSVRVVLCSRPSAIRQTAVRVRSSTRTSVQLPPEDPAGADWAWAGSGTTEPVIRSATTAPARIFKLWVAPTQARVTSEPLIAVAVVAGPIIAKAVIAGAIARAVVARAVVARAVVTASVVAGRSR